MIEVKSQHIFYMKALKQLRYINNIIFCEFLQLVKKIEKKIWIFFPIVVCAIGLIVKRLIS
jgi:hypothetical protein